MLPAKQPSTRNVSVDATISSWQKAKSLVRSNCKELLLLSEGQDVPYLLKLFNAIGGVTYDSIEKSFVAISENQTVSIEFIDKKTSNNSTSGPSCWVVWVGDTLGAGKIAYETMAGQIKTLQVNEYPLPAPPDGSL